MDAEIDEDTLGEDDTFLPFDLAYNPWFDFIDWYGKQLSKKICQLCEKRSSKNKRRYIERNVPGLNNMGRPLAERIEMILNKSGPYPGDIPKSPRVRDYGKRFSVWYRPGENIFEVMDRVLDFVTFFPALSLTPDCDVVRMYRT
jgi:hypothetical protein